MNLVITYFFSWIVFGTNVQAAKGAKFQFYGDITNYYACNYQISQTVSFCESPTNVTCLCSNKNALATYAGCFAFDNRNKTKALNFLIEYCEEYGNVTVEKDWYEKSYQYYLAKAKTEEEIPNFNATIPIDVPFKLDEAETKLYEKAYKQFLGNYDDSLYYGAAALGYWLLIMCIGAIVNWGKVIFPGLTKKLTSKPINIWRQYVSMPATFQKRKAEAAPIFKFFDSLIPSRLESIVIFLFYILILIIHAINMHYVDGDPVFNNDKYQSQVRNVADRTGITGTIMMPLVFLFASRNNFLQWLTGWNYSTFVTYHRHIARVMFILIALHSILFTILLRTDMSEFAETYMIWGVLATVTGGIILFQAMLFFRRRWYEIFLLIHILFAALYVAGTWIHVDELGYVWFVYPSVAVWCVDRVVRIARLVVFGFPKAQVTLLADETIKVEIPKPSYWKTIPGGHAFIHFLKPTYFWQSHPFTFVESPTDTHIILYCKVKGGITHSLYQLLGRSPGQTTSMRVGVEGPYGESTAARYADTAVFIAGGNGIPGIYSEVMDMARRMPSETKKAMKLYWIIRDYKSLEWFNDELAVLQRTNIETTIYVTKPDLFSVSTEDGSDDTSSKKESDSQDMNVESKEPLQGVDVVKSRFSHITFKEGRPSIENIVDSEIKESNGSIAFVACGHPAMVDETRYFCSRNVDNPQKKRVDFYEQVQVWT
ncbi:ferric reductase and cupric reductase, putative [Candida dubliniensis CD36]|uniref:ferric-chelate reductase (NADPH) n=1 Tax=Candida dubliniensis (strain CD36 / ATCC MYA-646 / CBS 7987 / NCPF 3949 / NRRL Y-17841) TaxID=573826 RepID=B9WH39_CANDC|nr:ferric reductase and cupric reductase, putative [Candida dubliniensis CD36]CAX41480.1 ferric reductase and cupric reductase, putative [Candida dubliniensis CD36]